MFRPYSETSSSIITTSPQLRKRCETEQKRLKRLDYYKYLSKSPSVRRLLKMKQGEIWKTCGDSDSEDEPAEFKSEVSARRQKVFNLNALSKPEDIKAAYKQRCLDLHPDKQMSRLKKFEDDTGNVLTDAQKARIKERTDEHFKAVGEAFEILQDVTKRRLFDEGYDKDEIGNRATSSWGWA